MKYLILIVTMAFVLVSCNNTPTGEVVRNIDGATVTTTERGEEVKTVMESDDGRIEVTAKEGADDWCQTGAAWNMNSEATSGDARASWTIDKLETSGEYKGYCHVLYTVKSPEGDVKMEYWFDESGKNGYYEMDVEGQKYTQEWHG